MVKAVMGGRGDGRQSEEETGTVQNRTENLFQEFVWEGKERPGCSRGAMGMLIGNEGGVTLYVFDAEVPTNGPMSWLCR